MKKILNIFIIALIFASSSQAQEVSAYLNKKQYQIGDYIHYTAKITSDKKLTNIHPVLTDTLNTAEIIAQLPLKEDKEGGKNIYLLKMVLAKYDSGEVKVPQLAITYNYENDEEQKTLTAGGVSAQIYPVQIDTAAGIKDVKGPQDTPWNWKLILLIWLIAGLIITAVILFIFFKKKRALAKLEPEAILLPHERAFNQLTLLENKKLWQSGQVKEYHTEITEIIRKYFAERFGFPALELTSGEAIEYLRQNNEAHVIIDETAAFLTNADMVKFAKFVPMNQVNEEMMEQARKIVELTMQTQEPGKTAEAENVQQR
ncbi:MAG TPA: hypothetical protein VHO28_04725 [Ignavibacteriales bacterium]|nr:hypothetical protein [Ignavibacteriales bacterium]